MLLKQHFSSHSRLILAVYLTYNIPKRRRTRLLASDLQHRDTYYGANGPD